MSILRFVLSGVFLFSAILSADQTQPQSQNVQGQVALRDGGGVGGGRLGGDMNFGNRDNFSGRGNWNDRGNNWNQNRWDNRHDSWGWGWNDPAVIYDGNGSSSFYYQPDYSGGGAPQGYHSSSDSNYSNYNVGSTYYNGFAPR